jgi:class 3 adenylate cyclase
MAKKKKIEKPFVALIITGLVFLIITGLHFVGVFNYLEKKSYDMRVRFWANSTYSIPSHEIVVVLLDQDSIDWAKEEREWYWPWPRQAYAEIVDYMNLSEAKSVIFDVLFSEPSLYRSANQDEIIDRAIHNLEEMMLNEEQGETPRQVRTADIDRRPRDGVEGQPRQRLGFRAIRDDMLSLKERADDASFMNATENFGRVVHAVMFSSQTGLYESWPEGLEKPLFQPENFTPIIDHFSISDGMRAQFPIAGLRKSAGALGSVTGKPDADGVFRRVQPFTIFDDRAVPSLSTASLLVTGYDHEIYFNQKDQVLEWGERTIPVDKNGFALLRFRGQVDRYIPYRAKDILLSAEAYEKYLKGEGELLEFGRYETRMGRDWINYTPDNFKDTYVFFGFYAQGLYDTFSSPISSLYAGVGFHITMLDNLLMDDFIKESSTGSDILILLVIIISIVCLSMFPNRIYISVGGMVFILLAIVIGAFIAYQFGGLWIPMITLLAGALASFVTVTIYNYSTEGSQKRFIKSAFSQYLSPKVIEQLIHDPSRLKLGGEKREMTAIFTDVRAFSTFSEALGDPAKLVELLNFYLTRMSNIVLDNQGTIDKYEGDAIIAFFGAPIHFDNHASLACRAAVNMKKAEKDINRDALELGLITPAVMEAMAKKGAVASLDDPCPIFTRIGMNTGDMVVGNMGTPNKMDYTIMGNAVNLAARLEGVNKQYDTSGILISEYTRAFIGDEFILRPLSRVRVVGINTPLRLYELLDIAGEAPQDLVDMVKSWEQAFDFYEKRDFLSAKNLFQGIIDKNITLFGSADKVVKKYLDRCVNYLAAPPDEKAWDEGVDNLTEK